VACFRAQGDWFGRVAEAATSISTFQVRSFKSLDTAREAWAFAQWCRTRQLAVVHTTDMPSNIFGLPAAALARVPVRIANRREINAGKSLAGIALQRTAYASAHKIVANSRAAADRLLFERVPAHKIRIFPNGLDPDRFITRSTRLRGRKVVVVANLRREKAHDVLIDAAPEILRRHPDARFEFIGGGSEREALVARATDRGVLDQIAFVGHCDDVADRLAGGDIFVLPSRTEAFPNAILEAMAAGLPVVATAVGGVCELIEHEQTGLLVARDDPRSLADQICRVMSDQALASRLSHSARAQARARYSFDRMVAQFEDLYLSELARRRGLEPDSGTRTPEHHATARRLDGGAQSLHPSDGGRGLQPSGKVLS
jgi:glycosyltransferase involved in cell wall biosynthesis